MEITFKNTKAEKQFSSKYKKSWTYPQQVKLKLEAAENFILQASSLADVANYIPFHFEKLIGNRNGEWSIRLGGKTGYRVILYPCDEAGKEIIGGDILAKCKTIQIIMVTEVTNHYE